MPRGGLLALALLLGCSASGGTGAPSSGSSGGASSTGQGGSGGTEPTAGEGGEPSAAGSGGSGGSGGAPDLCKAGDERLCSCAPTYGGKQLCTDFGWSICTCPDWPPLGGNGGSGGTEPTGPFLGSDCMTGTDDCASMEAPTGKPPVCMQADGLAGGNTRPGHCTWTCTSGAADSTACIQQGGDCEAIGELVSHCVVW